MDAAPALKPIQTKSVPFRAGSFTENLCHETGTAPALNQFEKSSYTEQIKYLSSCISLISILREIFWYNMRKSVS